jgi:uncharacterized membrane protein
MRSESGLRRLVNFSDAVVAVAITLLILPLVDAAGAIHGKGIDHFLRGQASGLVGFFLSFAVIGSFWWGQHVLFERVKGYNTVLVAGMFVWLLSIVFLPFSTELIQSTVHGLPTAHAIYIGTMVVTALAALVQQWSIIRWPELRHHPAEEPEIIDESAILAVLMGAALVVTIVAPRTGLWPLALLLLTRPLVRLSTRRRTRHAVGSGDGPPPVDPD